MARPIYNRLSYPLQQFADCLLEGKTNEQISNELKVSYETTKNQMRRLLDQVGADSRLQCANILAIEMMHSDDVTQTH